MNNLRNLLGGLRSLVMATLRWPLDGWMQRRRAERRLKGIKLASGSSPEQSSTTDENPWLMRRPNENGQMTALGEGPVSVTVKVP